MNDQLTQPAVHQLAIASVQINFAASNITQTIIQCHRTMVPERLARQPALCLFPL